MDAPLSIQLYTLREAVGSLGLAAVIERVARIGYTGIEPAGFMDLSPKALRHCADQAGVAVSAMHVELPNAENADRVFDAQAELGNDVLVVPFLPPDCFGDEARIQAAADALNEADARARARGMSLGYHNHQFEFTSRIGERAAYDVFFEKLEPSVFAEVDVYWAQVGGVDPVELVRRLGARARLLHVKDGPADDPASDMTAVGEGAVDVGGVLAVSRAAWHIVELDRCATDMWEAVETSHRNLEAMRGPS